MRKRLITFVTFFFILFSFHVSLVRKPSVERSVLLLGQGYVIWRFIPCGEQRVFCLLQTTRWFFWGFSQPVRLTQVFILLALRIHFTPPCSKRKGKIHPATDHEGPQGNIDIAVLFLQRRL